MILHERLPITSFMNVFFDLLDFLKNILLYCIYHIVIVLFVLQCIQYFVCAHHLKRTVYIYICAYINIMSLSSETLHTKKLLEVSL